MKSLIDLILEDAMINDDIFYSPEEEMSDGEIISKEKKSMLVDQIYWLMETCVDNCEDRETEVEYFQEYKEELDRFIAQHISSNLSKKDFDACINNAVATIKRELWLDRAQSGLVNRFARFLKQM